MSNWSNPFVRPHWLLAVGIAAALSGCHSSPAKSGGADKAAQSQSIAPAVPKSPAPAGNGAASSPVSVAAASAPNSANAPQAVAAPQAPVPERAAQQYSQALQMVKNGRSTDAELEFKQLSAAYPQLAGPQVNLGLLYLKDSRLKDAEGAFKAALKINPANAVAGNELGIVERRLGKFTEAEAVYQKAIDAEPTYAPAHLNLGVLYDLYLAQPQKALDEFQRYIEIAGENKQVSGWVIELKKRVGGPPAKKEPA